MALAFLTRFPSALRSQTRCLSTAEQVLQKHGVKTANSAEGIEYSVRFEKSASGAVTLIFSPEALDVAQDTFPEVLVREEITPTASFPRLAYKYGFTDWIEGGEQLQKLYNVFSISGASSLNVPLVQTSSAEVFAVAPVFSSPNRLAEL